MTLEVTGCVGLSDDNAFFLLASFAAARVSFHRTPWLSRIRGTFAEGDSGSVQALHSV